MPAASTLKTQNHSYLSQFFLLTKLRINLATTFTVTSGFVLYSGGFSIDLFYPAAGLFLAGSGSAGFNQLSETKTDALMNRTMNRPLVTGELTAAHAIFICTLLIIGGLFIMYLHSALLALTGIAAVLWYNLIYTYLKRVTAFAVFPGALIGAFPPYAGWVAAGGELIHPAILTFCVFFFVWQIPHFWILMIVYGEEYTEAGLPSVTSLFHTEQIKRLIFIWVISFGLLGSIMPLFLSLHDVLYVTLITGTLTIFLFIAFIPLVKNREFTRFKLSFLLLNVYTLAIVLLIMIARLDSGEVMA